MVIRFNRNKDKGPTYKERVQRFWEWFPSISNDVSDALERGNVDEVMAQVDQYMSDQLPRFAWVFGPGIAEGHSLTLSGEGQKALQLLCQYWLVQGISVSGWTFFGSRQPCDSEQLKSMAIDIGSSSLDAEGIRIAAAVDEDNRRVDIDAWHPVFEELDESAQYRVLFLMLDEALGEFGTQMQVGEINIEMADDSMSLIDFPYYLNNVSESYQWQRLSPLDEYTAYRSEEPTDAFPRGDTIAGHTLLPNIVLEFLNNGGSLEDDPFEDTGAEFAYLAIDGEVFPEGEELDERGRIESAISSQMAGSIQVVGAATGVHASYIDLVIIDGDRALDAMDNVLAKLGLNGKYRLEHFKQD